MDRSAAQQYAIRLAPAAASVANFCDHTEHNEIAERDWVLGPAATLRALALEMAESAGLRLVELYAERLGEIEARNVLVRPGAFDGHRAALEADSWRALQLVQAEHDRHYHPDVCGLMKAEQLRHYALHLAKIVGAFAEPADEDELLRRRLPDILLFAIKLSTVMGKRLPDEPLPEAPPRADALRATTRA
jgi:hypothetical protein